MRPVKLIAGLGNPGAEYRDTRHNAGFWWVERLAAELNVPLASESKFFGWVGKVRQAQNEFWLLQPATYMNRSGRAVLALAHYYRILPDEILVVHDEVDLPPGSLKIKRGGGSAGNNGIKDIAAALTTPDFWRLRIGVGHPGHRDLVADYVLHPPRREEQEAIDRSIAASLECWPLLVAGNFEAAMLKLHTKPRAPAAPEDSA